MQKMTKIPLSRLRPSPSRPVFPRRQEVQEDFLMPSSNGQRADSGYEDPLDEYLRAEESIASAETAPSPAAAQAPRRARQPSRNGGFQTTASVGQQCLQARSARGWTIEDVAFQTHIPHTLLRDMENDDLSNFANLTYAKGFLKLYSRHLGLDLRDYLDQFDTSEISTVTGHEYIQTANLVHNLSAPAIAPDAFNSGLRPRMWLIALGAILFLAFGRWVFLKFSGPSADPAPSSQSAAPGTAPTPASVISGRASSPDSTQATAGVPVPPRAEIIID